MKSPLKPKRTDFSFCSGVFDYKFIREHAAPNPFGIEPGPPPVHRWFCSENGCTRWSEGTESGGTCASYCLY